MGELPCGPIETLGGDAEGFGFDAICSSFNRSIGSRGAKALQVRLETFARIVELGWLIGRANRSEGDR